MNPRHVIVVLGDIAFSSRIAVLNTVLKVDAGG
jgi:hypothetical protein